MVQHRVILITGSARGIGFEIGKRFAELGDLVVLSDRDRSAVELAADQLRQLGLQVIGLELDVTSEMELAETIQKVEEMYGRLDILINNAGMQHVSYIEDFPTEKFEQMIKVMLVAPFMAMKQVIPLMKKHGFGRIINIASINGLVGFAGKAAYNSAKHGVIGLTKAAALETARYGITVNALCPGYVDTTLVREQLSEIASTRNIPIQNVMEEVIFPFVPQHRLLEVYEVAEYAIFLAAAHAKGITGQAIVIDGGYTAQ